MSTADFKMIRPLTVTDALLTSITVPETVAATYAGGTTYAAGDRVGLAPVYGAAQLVYESLSAGNVGNPLPVPPATTTAFWAYVSSVYPPYASGSSCGVGGIVSSVSTDVHLLYESLVAANTGNALTDTTKWMPLGSTNARAMFDVTYGSQTTQVDEIVFVITPGTIINSVFLGNLDASSVTVTQSVSGYTSTQALNSHQVLNWYDWYYEDIIHKNDVVFLDVPPYPASTLTITITSPGGTAGCGLCVVGKAATIGTTRWEVFAGIVSYSGTTTDGFGNTTFLARAGVKKLNLDVYVQPGFESEAHRLLSIYTDTPMVFIGSTEYDLLMLYGYLGEWSVPVSIVGKTAPIELRGLI